MCSCSRTARTGRGAFLFRSSDDNPVPFVEVKAKGRSEQFSVDGQTLAALNLWQLGSEEPVSGAVYRQQLAASCFSQIVALLNGGQQGRSGFLQAVQLRGCMPSDIAILVRDGREVNN